MPGWQIWERANEPFSSSLMYHAGNFPLLPSLADLKDTHIRADAAFLAWHGYLCHTND